MATIIYEKFFKKKPTKITPQDIRPCSHQRMTSIDSAMELTSSCHHHSDITSATANEGIDISKQNDRLQSSSASSVCSMCREEQGDMKRCRWKLMAGLFFPFLVQSLDSTIIAGALPFIASDFPFTLTSATFIPSWGQCASIFGRYAALQSALILMILGSILCSAAPVTAFTMLLVGRAFQGLGCAGLLIICKVILADKVSPEQNAKNNTTFTIVGGVGYGIRPILGGYLTSVSWRWCFIINIPLALIGLALVHFILRKELLGPEPITRTDGTLSSSSGLEIPQTFTASLNTLDFGGQFLFLFGMGLFVLDMAWGGAYYPWSDIKVIIPLAIGVILILAFLIWEYLMLPGHILSLRFPTKKAMINFKLLGIRNAGLLMYINFCTGMYAVYYFVELYFVLVLNYGASKAGTNLVYYMPGLGGGALLANLLVNRTPRQTFFPLFFGTLLEPLGITILAVALHTNNTHLLFGMLALTGVGTGLRFMPGTLHGVAYYLTQIAAVVPLMSLSVSLGGTLATTVMLNIFQNEISKDGLSFHASASSSFDAINALPADQPAFLRSRLTHSLVVAFYALTAFMWLGGVASSLLGNVRIGRDGEKDRITKGSFVWHCFGGR